MAQTVQGAVARDMAAAFEKMHRGEVLRCVTFLGRVTLRS